MAAMPTAAAAAASLDRLSDLPDDVLIHILSFIPTREAARTTALSRRWRRPLWIYTGAINLDYRHYSTGAGGVPLRMRAVDDADLALSFQNSIGRGPPKKVALVMRDGTMHDDILRAACRREEDEDDEDEDEDTSGVEELRLECLEYGVAPHCIHAAPSGWTYYDLSLVSLPFAGLRVLELTGCILHTRSPSPSSQESEDEEEEEDESEEEGSSEEESEQGEERRITFPSLGALRLRRCRTAFNTLQDMVLAAPWLADLLLEAVSFTDDHYTHHLRCPAATSITMANCHKLHTDNLPFLPCIMELDAPRLRRLSYSQVHTFNFKETSHTCFPYDDSWSAPPDLEQVHLALLTASEAAGLRRSMLRSVSGVRVLILTLYSLGDLAVYGLPYFYKLERLEIEELCGCIVNHGEAARAIEKMLRHCPVVRHLHLRFRWREYLAEAGDPADQIAAMADLTPCRSINNTGYDDDEEDCCESLDFCYRHSARDLDCLLKGSLKRLEVEFDAEELTCFQVRLIRFLAREAAGLEEVVVDGGKGYNSSRIDRKVERWRRKWKRSPPTKSVAPLWPLSLSEFPLPLKAPAAPTPLTPTSSDVEVHNGLQFYDDDEEEETDYEDDVSPRHFIRGGRKKKKKGGTLECFSVKPMAKVGLIKMRPRRGGANRRRRSGWDWFVEEGDIEGSSASTHIVPAISTPQRPPTMSEFPSLLPPSPPVRRSLPSLLEPSAVDRASSSAAECPSQDAQVGSCPTDSIGALREWRAVRLADLEVTTGMTSRHRYLPRRRPLAPTMPSGRRCTAAFRIHQP